MCGSGILNLFGGGRQKTPTVVQPNTIKAAEEVSETASGNRKRQQARLAAASMGNTNRTGGLLSRSSTGGSSAYSAV